MYQAGFFPVMMFGLPAVRLLFINVHVLRRKVTASLMLALVLRLSLQALLNL